MDSFFDYIKQLANTARGFFKRLFDFFRGKSGKSPADEANRKFENAAFDVANQVFIPAVRRYLEIAKHVYTGKTVDTLRAEPQGDGSVVIKTDSGYFYRVEYGTEKRNVGVEEKARLLDWVRFKHPDVENPYAYRNSVVKTIQEQGNFEHAPFFKVLESVQGELGPELVKKLSWEFGNG